jgi:hypothetical protein
MMEATWNDGAGLDAIEGRHFWVWDEEVLSTENDSEFCVDLKATRYKQSSENACSASE